MELMERMAYVSRVSIPIPAACVRWWGAVDKVAFLVLCWVPTYLTYYTYLQQCPQEVLTYR